MGDFSTFFRESDQSLGVFYPKNHIIATFPTYTLAKKALEAVRLAGTAEADVMLSTGEEVLAYFKDFREDAGLWGVAMRYLSKLLATEVKFSNRDIEQAKEGAGFLAIYCTSDQDAKKVVAAVRPFTPSSMELYLAGGIRSLI